MITEPEFEIDVAEAVVCNNPDNADSANCTFSADDISDEDAEAEDADSAIRNPLEDVAALAESNDVETRIFCEFANNDATGDTDASAKAIRSASTDASDVQDSIEES